MEVAKGHSMVMTLESDLELVRVEYHHQLTHMDISMGSIHHHMGLRRDIIPLVRLCTSATHIMITMAMTMRHLCLLTQMVGIRSKILMILMGVHPAVHQVIQLGVPHLLVLHLQVFLHQVLPLFLLLVPMVIRISHRLPITTAGMDHHHHRTIRDLDHLHLPTMAQETHPTKLHRHLNLRHTRPIPRGLLNTTAIITATNRDILLDPPARVIPHETPTSVHGVHRRLMFLNLLLISNRDIIIVNLLFNAKFAIMLSSPPSKNAPITKENAV
mmetsp:Transcript_26564/g.55941  ORF Transcript_26564/g.55941 Transcript_26564/m.55941 type:complete len:271 (+) Transcript_26564:1196-2008(+)